VGKKGGVRNPQDRASAVWQVIQAAQALGWQYQGLVKSPITGPAGNVEYLLWLQAGEPCLSLTLTDIQNIVVN
jgi:23S rRNA (cytidine1920-2'-O)/16S rRNA (cytidine1409-2'-O)-methyltransferase